MHINTQVTSGGKNPDGLSLLINGEDLDLEQPAQRIKFQGLILLIVCLPNAVPFLLEMTKHADIHHTRKPVWHVLPCDCS